MLSTILSLTFSFPAPAPTEIYTLSLHDALPISLGAFLSGGIDSSAVVALMAQESSEQIKTFSIGRFLGHQGNQDRKSTRLNSSHVEISYAVFCLKKKKNQRRPLLPPERLPNPPT